MIPGDVSATNHGATTRRRLLAATGGYVSGGADTFGPRASGSAIAGPERTGATMRGAGSAAVPAKGDQIMPGEPFSIAIPQVVLDDLQERLERTRWPDAIPDAGWDYGADAEYMGELIDYWTFRFDWRAQEAALNRFDHYRAEVDGIGIHFIHQRGSGDNPTPLTEPGGDGGDAAVSFDVVAASLPGYGFSDIPATRGMSVARMAELFHTLMTDVLGYERYAARGSDLGAGVISQLSLRHPEPLIGIHLSGTNPNVM